MASSSEGESEGSVTRQQTFYKSSSNDLVEYTDVGGMSGEGQRGERESLSIVVFV